MQSILKKLENSYKKSAVVDVRSGDTVRVHQKIVEGGKERIQIFEGLVIRVDRKSSITSSITVRRIASGIGVEKSYLLHSPNVVKIEVTKRSKVRRNYLTYMRERTGKRARLLGVDFDKQAVNDIPEDTPVDETTDSVQDSEVQAVQNAPDPVVDKVEKTQSTKDETKQS